MVTVPAAIYIIFQHLLAGVVKSRLAARFGDGDSGPSAGSMSTRASGGPANATARAA